MVEEKPIIEGLARTCLLLALVGALVTLGACSPASREKDSSLVGATAPVAAAQAMAAPPAPAATAVPPPARPAPAAPPVPPTATATAVPLAAGPATPTPTAARAKPEKTDAGADKEAPGAGVAVEGPVSKPLAASALAGIQVSYRLDPWLIGGTYGGELWVSPPVFGPTTQGGSTFALQVRAQGLDAQGNPVVISPQWNPADPETLAVSPSQGSVVTLTVQRAGQSSLQVVSQGFSKTLSIVAAYRGSALLVEISQ